MQLDLFQETAREQTPAPTAPVLHVDGGDQAPLWGVFVAAPEGAPEIPPIPVSAPARAHAERIGARYAGVAEDRCLALEAKGDFADQLMVALDEMNRRAEADLRRLRQIHAQILGCAVEELDARVAEDKRLADDARAKRQQDRPARGKATAPASPRGAQRKLVDEPAAPPTRRLDDRQRALLGLVAVEGNRAVYTSTEHVPDWRALKEVVETLGGRWRTGGRKRRGGWDFPEDIDAAEVIRLAQETGEVLDLKAAGLFETPVALAEELVRLAEIPPSATVLEPSAGRGRIALAVRRLHPDARVLCAELLPPNRTELERLGFELVGEDFLSLRPGDMPPVDAVPLNPPFARFAEVDHVKHALRCVRPGGRVAAIMSAAVRYRDAAPYARMRAIIAANDGTIIDCPEGAFLESGTGVRTVMVAMRRCG